MTTWVRRVSPSSDDYGPGIAYGGDGVFVATTFEGSILRSDDSGITWTQVEVSLASAGFSCLGYGDGVWLAGTYDSPAKIYRSTDATNFALVVSPPAIPQISALVFDSSGTWLAVGYGSGPSNYAISSDGGVTWTVPAMFTNTALAAALWDGNQFVAAGITANGDSDIVVSADGLSWTETVLTGANLTYLAFDGDSYIVAGPGDITRHAASAAGLAGASDVNTGLSNSAGVGTIGAGNGVMLFSDLAAGLALSVDHGATWTLQTDMFDAAKNVNGIAYGNHTFVLVGDSGNIATYSQPSGGGSVTGTLDATLDGVTVNARGQSWYRRLARELHRVGFTTESFTFQRMIRELRRVRYGNSEE